MRFFVLTVCALASSASSLALAATGQFTTVNGKIYDPSGNLFVANGVNIPGYNSWIGRDPSNDVNLIANDWNFNMVRVMDQPFATWTAPGAATNLANIISNYTSKGIVVVVETHESSDTYYQGAQLTQAANWYASLAAQYKNNPYVWFSTGNEPGNETQPAAGTPAAATWDQWTPDGQKWLTQNQTIMSAIRATGNTSIMLADGTNDGQDQAWDDKGNLVTKHSAVLTYGPTLTSQFSNVVFDTHIYGEWSSPGAISSRLPQYIQATEAENLPLIFGEYGATVFGDWYQTQADFMKVADQYDIGKVAWSWSDSGGWNLTTSADPNAVGTTWANGGGYLINSPTNPTNLSPFGQLVWNDTHTLIALPEPTSLLAACGLAFPLLSRRRK
jgi:mannan endo-1,4-beta-mannosidase